MQKNKGSDKQTSIALEKLYNLIQYLEFAYSNTDSWRSLLRDGQYIEEILIEMSADKKIDHARFASKLKNMFFRENQDLKTENAKLRKELKELKND